ncbi:transcriptional regulator, TetR family [Alteribacillus persepolensis]|uniref:Transcriptional regulator, TetR family n=1 Tax=Alteribacillus persepolensis TaxID=568899 RepID=A0A1G8J128_9BACI|nr:TetR/AcrR family transcriptional regulator [Alteribacillus persepolensis]SDI24846.1 transcriptional regulator, TetR family [Alteribacillus persepolensis]
MKLREKKAAKKKEEILRSASKIISRRGYDGATMEDIAAELLMTKGALYYYFKNKEELLYQCHVLVLSEAEEKLESIYRENISSIEKMRKAIRFHIEVAITEKETFNLIIKPEMTFSEKHISKVLKQRDDYAGVFDKIIQEGVQSGEFVVKEKKMARMIILGSMNWIQQWYIPGGEKGIDDISKVYAEYLLKMLT